MNSIKKIIFAVLMFVLIAVSMFPISSYAALTPDIFNFSKPYVSSTTGYIAVKGERTDLDNLEQCFLFYYQITPSVNSSLTYIGDDPLFVIDSISGNTIHFYINGDPLTQFNFSFCLMHQDGTVQDLGHDTFTGDYSFGVVSFHSSYLITNIDCQGNIDRFSLDSEYPTFDYLFAEDKYEYIYLLSIFNVLVEYGDLSLDEYELLQNIVDSTSDISDTLTQLKTEFSLQLIQIIEYNEVFKEKLELLLSYTDDVETILSNFYDEVVSYLYIIDEDLLFILDSVDDLEANTDEIEQLLQKLLDEFTYTGTNVISQPDTSVLNGYYEAEGELLDNLQLSAPLNVDINSNALAFCWDTVELFFLSHDKVLAAVLVVLSFGIMAMVLGR